MLIDFQRLHAEHLVGRLEGSNWVYTPANATNPRAGLFPTSHQVFSNHALQIAVYIYNAVVGGQCTRVSHCLYLLFTRRVDGRYLLADDPDRMPLNLDIGVASGLYALAQGHVERFTHSVVRSQKAAKHLTGICTYRDGTRALSLTCESFKDGRPVKIEVMLDRADIFALAAHCIAYGRLLYPWLSDAAVQSLLSEYRPDFRACAELAPQQAQITSPVLPEDSGDSPQKASHEPAQLPVERSSAARLPRGRLANVVWAIGNQKWERMNLDALRRIQSIPDEQLLQTMVDEANAGNFKSWDAHLILPS